MPLTSDIYRQLFYSNPLPMWIYDLATLHFMEVNNAAIAKYGYSKEEFLTLTLKDIRPEDDAARLLATVDTRNNKNYSFSGVWKHIKKNGDMLYADISSHLFQLEGKEAVLVLANDITETKKAEEILERKNHELVTIKNELERSEKRLREAQAMAHFGSWDADAVTYDTIWSDEVYSIFGINKNETTPSFEAFLSFIHPDDIGRVKEIIQHGKKSLEAYSIDCRIIRHDGILRYISSNCKFVLNKEGNPARVYGIIHDITERHKAEEERLQSEARLKQAQTIAKMGNWEVNFATNISKWSDEAYRIYGLKPGDHQLSYEKWLAYVHPDDLDYVQREIEKSQIALDDYSLYHRIVRADGVVRHLYSECTYEFDHAGKLIGLYGLVYDLTERKKNELELKNLNEQLTKRAGELAASNAELERFAYVASHDLQEPLRMVSSFLELLERKYKAGLDETALQYIRFSVDGAQRMKRLIMDLLEYSKVGSNHDEFSDADMGEIVTQVLNTFESRIQKTKAEIKIQFLPVIKANTTQMSQLLQNLIGNAFKYNTSPSPLIEIGSKEDKDKWQFFVRDNGIGVDRKYFEKIFAIFQRLHNKSQFSGTGIGLAICKKIIEKHGGDIWVESVPEKGSTFFFTIKK